MFGKIRIRLGPPRLQQRHLQPRFRESLAGPSARSPRANHQHVKRFIRLVGHRLFSIARNRRTKFYPSRGPTSVLEKEDPVRRLFFVAPSLVTGFRPRCYQFESNAIIAVELATKTSRSHSKAHRS
jgi:hypothetical protein